MEWVSRFNGTWNGGMVEWWNSGMVGRGQPIKRVGVERCCLGALSVDFRTYLKASRLITKLRTQPSSSTLQIMQIANSSIIHLGDPLPILLVHCIRTHVHAIDCSMCAMFKSASETDEWVALQCVRYLILTTLLAQHFRVEQIFYYSACHWCSTCCFQSARFHLQ